MLININKIAESGKKNKRQDCKSEITSIIIVLLGRERIEAIKSCIRSIKTNTETGTYEIITVIGLNKDGHIPWIQQHSDIVLLYHHQSQENVIAAYHEAMEIAKGKQILLLDPYTIVTSHWLAYMVEALYSTDMIGAVGPRLKINMDVEEKSADMPAAIPCSVKLVENLPEGCILIKSAVVEQVGALDRQIPAEQNISFDYGWRIQLAGYRLGVSLASQVYLYEDSKANANALSDQTFQDKWGISLVHYKQKLNSMAAQLEFMQSDLAKGKKNILVMDTFAVLDLCKMKDKAESSALFGVTRSQLAAQLGRASFAFTYVDSWDDSTPYADDFFDLIYLPEEWSGLAEPEKFLGEIKRILKMDGLFVFKAPNALFYKRVYAIVRGEKVAFPAENFYTCADILALLQQQGFVSERVSGFFVPTIERRLRFNELQALMTKDQQQFLAVKEFYIAANLQRKA